MHLLFIESKYWSDGHDTIPIELNELHVTNRQFVMIDFVFINISNVSN